MRVRHDLAGPGPCPTVILPQSMPAPFAHCVNPSSSISSFMTLVSLDPVSILCYICNMRHFTFSNVSSCTWSSSSTSSLSPILLVVSLRCRLFSVISPLFPDLPHSPRTSLAPFLSHLTLALPAGVSLPSTPPFLRPACLPSPCAPLSHLPCLIGRHTSMHPLQFCWSGAIPDSRLISNGPSSIRT